MRLRAAAGAAVAALQLGACASAAPDAAPFAGGWRGSFVLPRPVAISLQVRGTHATVVLPGGHPGPTTVAVTRRSGGLIRFSLPGRPTPLVFSGRLRGGAIRGTVAQAGLRGSFTLRRGKPLPSGGLGVYRLDSGDAVSVTAPAAQRLLVDYDASEIHGLFAAGGARWDVGSGLGTRAPVAGSAVLDGTTLDLTLGGARHRGARVPQVEREVRFRSGGTWLAGTLAVPAGARGRPGVVLVHGSGATTRNDPAVVAAFLGSRGFAVLTYDKRGIGQSGGTYPGEAATPTSVAAYAKDAAAAARFLAAQPEVDRSRVGLAGSSQAGWIAPVAAARERAVRFLALVSGPTVTAGEVDTYAALTTQGRTIPAEPPAAILDRVREGGRSGFDPLPWLRALTIPSLWLYGALDQHVPTPLCVERLAPLAGPSLEYRVFPHADHYLIESEHGLTDEDLRSHRYAAGAFAALATWLDANGLR